MWTRGLVVLSLFAGMVSVGVAQEFSSYSAISPDEALFFPGTPVPNYWVRGDFVFGWLNGANLPPLVTTSPLGTDAADSGILGGDTSVLFGGRVNADRSHGFRLAAGYILNHESQFGVEADFLFLGNQKTNFAADSDDIPILARPYIDATSFTPQAVLIAHPDRSSGSVSIEAESGNFYSARINTTERFWTDGPLNWSFLFGYRFAHYDDSIKFDQTQIPIFAPGTPIVSRDVFQADNNLHGLDVGLRSEIELNTFTLNLLARMTIGNLRQKVTIDGQQEIGGIPATHVGGVYALQSNIGSYRDNSWVIWPELGGTLHWQIRPNLKCHVGYSALYLSEIARASDQIDTTINPDLFPPVTPGADPQQPRFQMEKSDAWLHTINLGLELTF